MNMWYITDSGLLAYFDSSQVNQICPLYVFLGRAEGEEMKAVILGQISIALPLHCWELDVESNNNSRYSLFDNQIVTEMSDNSKC